MTLAEELTRIAAMLRETRGRGMRLTPASILLMSTTLDRIASSVRELEKLQRQSNVVVLSAWRKEAQHEH